MQNPSPTQNNNQLLLQLKIQTKTGTSFNDKVRAVTSYNDRGVFDVLPEHENFISIIKAKIIIHLANGEKKEMNIDDGVMRVLRDEVHIFLGLTKIPN